MPKHPTGVHCNGEPANAHLARAHKLDDEIKTLRASGLTAPQIAERLKIYHYQVHEAKKRLGLKKPHSTHGYEIEDTRPKRLYKCSMCRKEHWSTPHVRTCPSCRSKRI